ncbi:MAG: fibronectin type III domain-containing protein, partial [Actinobacteria bacterium]|nr:fibronectin type III domain-containing protein [Actinomycetota bacterium]
MPVNNTARSVEAWVKPTDGSFRYIAGWGTAANDRSFSVGADANQIGVIAYGDDRYFPTPRPLNDGAWHHVVVTYNGTTLTAYLDGASLGTRTFAASLATLNPSGLKVGADFQGGAPSYGGLDEVAVYPVTLTAAKVTAHFAASGYARPAAVTNLTATPGANQATVSWSGASSPNTPVTRYLVTAYAGTVAKVAEATDGANTSLVMSGLTGGTAYTFKVMASNAYGDGAVATSAAVTPSGSATTYAGSVLADAPAAYYRLGEGSGKTAADSSGKGANGLYGQATLGTPGAVLGDPDSAVVANASCCVLSSSPTLPVNNTARSVEAWIKPSDGYFRYIAGWGTAATDRSFSVGADANQIGVSAYYDDRYFATPSPLTDGAWHHVVVTYNGTTLTAYLDGASLGTRTFASSLTTLSPSGLRVG